MERYLKVIEEFEGYAETGAMITLIVGVGISILLLIFVGVLGGQAYSLTEPNINAINDTVIKDYVKDGITSGFQSLKTVGQYMPLIVLAVVISLVVGLIISFGGIGIGARAGAL
ncbi:MAG: hypothetical protein QXJ14_02005 [Candidatus Aenigmatarchaeota archaeon]